MVTESDRSTRALKLITERGIISKDKSLGDLLRISEELASIGGSHSEERGYWECIGPNFIWRGWDVAKLQEIEANRK